MSKAIRLRYKLIMQFEQLNENILLNEKVVFTVKQLQDYVALNIDYPKDLPFEPMGIHKAYLGRFDDFCIDQWLDTEVNFQSACTELFKQLK